MIHKKKSLGQHFLADENIARKIVRTADVHKDDTVWEIGPGSGVLTKILLGECKDLIAFEIDNQWFEYLKDQYKDTPLAPINTDILRIDFKDYYQDEKVKIVANLPYQITSPVLFKILENREFFKSITVMIQDEVADRLCAPSGNKEYGKLSIKLQLYFMIKKMFVVPAHVFRPPPKVRSAVVQLLPRKDVPRIIDHEDLWKLIDVVFNQRRKMLRASLRPYLPEITYQKLSKSTFDLTLRPEDLSVLEFVELSNYIKTLEKGV